MTNPFKVARRRLPDFVVRHRAIASVLANILVIMAAYTGAFLLRFDLTIPSFYHRTFLITLPAVVALQYVSFQLFKLTRGWWRYVGMGDFLAAVKASIVGAAGHAVFAMLVDRRRYPRSIFLLTAILVVGLSMGVRLAVRLWRQVPVDRDKSRKRLLIVGAGDTGEALLREIRQSPRMAYQVVAFVDDDVRKQGAYINGVPVLDGTEHLADIVSRFRIDEMIVATPSASGAEMRTITDRCNEAGVPFKVMPSTWEVLDGRAGLGALREVDINDLLRRPPVELDSAGINHFLHGKRVLVTGAAGSIGSEICRQVLRFGPAALHCLDHDENALFFLDRSLQSLQATTQTPIKYHLADITDATRIDTLFSLTSPQVVFHAAAHKHVPMIEANPVEGLRNNVFGTELVATMAGRHDAEAFVLISTDKAVNPSSVMGASKRIAEQLIQTLPFTTRYTAVRFGNVLGSQGSVVPILKEQIAAGGPITVTHPDMRRYFMTIPEAVELVIQAGAMGQGDEIFMLDMGEPVKILDLANDLIRLSGLSPGDIEIVFSGVRPGEKLYEELYLEVEKADTTTHPKILIARREGVADDRLNVLLAELRRAVDSCDEPAARRLIPLLVPEYGKRTSSDNVIPLAQAAAAQRERRITQSPT